MRPGPWASPLGVQRQGERVWVSLPSTQRAIQSSVNGTTSHPAFWETWIYLRLLIFPLTNKSESPFWDITLLLAATFSPLLSTATALIWTSIISLSNHFHSMIWSCYPHLSFIAIRMNFLKWKSGYGLLLGPSMALQMESFISIPRNFLHLLWLFHTSRPCHLPGQSIHLSVWWVLIHSLRSNSSYTSSMKTTYTLSHPLRHTMHLFLPPLLGFFQLQVDHGWAWNHLRTCSLTRLEPGLGKL